MRRGWMVLVVVPAGVLGLACELWAQVESYGPSNPEGSSEGKSDIFAGDLATAFWTVAIFVVLLWVLSRWAWKPILAGLHKREEHIRRSLDEAEQLKAQGQQMLVRYEQQLDQIRQEAQEIFDQRRDEAAHMVAELKEQTLQECKELRHKAQRDIERARDKAVQQLCQETAEMAAELAGHIIAKKLTEQDHRELLQESLSKLQNAEERL